MLSLDVKENIIQTPYINSKCKQTLGNSKL